MTAIQRFALHGTIMNPHSSGPYVRHEDHLAAMQGRCLAQIEERAGAAPAAVAPQGVVAWMHPETLNVISAAHKNDMSTEYGAETRRKAESYSVALVRAGEPSAAAPALEAPAAPAVPPLTPDEARWAARSADRMRGPSDVTSGTEYAMAGAMALAKKLAAAPQAPAAPSEIDAREQVTRALGLGANGLIPFAWSYLIGQIEGLMECEAELCALKAAPAAPAVDAKAHDWRENASYGGEICAECGAAKGSRRGNAPCAWPPEPLDVCTDPYNCARCKAHPNHRKGLEHAGISRPRSAAQAKEGGAA